MALHKNLSRSKSYYIFYLSSRGRLKLTIAQSVFQASSTRIELLQCAKVEKGHKILLLDYKSIYRYEFMPWLLFLELGLKCIFIGTSYPKMATNFQSLYLAEIFAPLLWNLSGWLLLPSFRFSQIFINFRRVTFEICGSSFLEFSKIRGHYKIEVIWSIILTTHRFLKPNYFNANSCRPRSFQWHKGQKHLFSFSLFSFPD